jgi:hypothetical protein
LQDFGFFKRIFNVNGFPLIPRWHHGVHVGYEEEEDKKRETSPHKHQRKKNPLGNMPSNYLKKSQSSSSGL